MPERDDLAVGLADAITTIRSELEDAINRGKESSLAFRAGPLEMEFEVVFSKSGTVETGVKAWVLSTGAKGELSRATTHRLKLTLTPTDRATGEDQLVRDRGDD